VHFAASGGRQDGRSKNLIMQEGEEEEEEELFVCD
jgi:hypothetical protein